MAFGLCFFNCLFHYYASIVQSKYVHIQHLFDMYIRIAGSYENEQKSDVMVFVRFY